MKPWTEALLDRIAVTNGLLMALRRGRVTPEKVREFIEDLSDLPIEIEPPQHPRAWPAAIALAQQHRLTAYDAAYLDLAQRHGLPLAILDDDLQKAARTAGVPLVGAS